MLGPIDWADYLRGTTAGATITVATLIASPVSTLPSLPRLAPVRETRPMTATPDKMVAAGLRDVHQWSTYDMASPLVDEGERPLSVAEELLAVADLPKEIVAQLAGVSRQALHKWVTGGGMTVEKTRHLEAVLATFRRLQALRGPDLRAFLETPTAAGRPLDLLAAGDTRAVIGLALRQSPPAVSPSTVSAAVRDASGIPSRLRPVKRLDRIAPRDRVAWEEARDRLNPPPLTDAPVDIEDEGDSPIFAAHVLAVN